MEALHLLDEVVEEVLAVVGPRGRLGVILHREGGKRAVTESLERLVVQVDVGDLDRLLRQAVDVDDEPVVLRGDLDRARLQVFHRVVGAVMAELELGGPAAQGQAQDLVAQADAEDRLPAEQLAHGLHRVADRLRVARAVGQEDPVRVPGQDFFRRGGGREDLELAAGPVEGAQDGKLDPEVVDRHAILLFRNRCCRFSQGPDIGLVGGHVLDDVAADELLPAPQPFEKDFRRPGLRGDQAHLGAVIAQVPGERPGVDVADPHDPMEGEVFVQRAVGLPVAYDRAVLPDDEARGIDAPRLEILGVYPVVADLGVGHCHQLEVVRRVGQYLLVAAHGRVEDHLADGGPLLAEGEALVVGAVG